MSFQINSVQEYFDTLGKRFVADASGGVDATYQFTLTGDGGGVWCVAVKDGGMTVTQGASDSPDSTIEAKTTDWVKIVNGTMSGMKAVMMRKMKVGGNVTLARKMQQMFPTA